MIGLEHDEGDCVSLKYFEILRGQQAEPAEHGSLRHNVDARRAHRLDDVMIGDRRSGSNTELPQALRVDAEGATSPNPGRPIWGRVPPQPDKTNFVDLAAHPLYRRQKLLTELSPPPPIMAQMHDIDAFRVTTSVADGSVVSEKEQRPHR